MNCLSCNKNFKSKNKKSNRLCILCKTRNKRGRFENYPNHDVVVDPTEKIRVPKIPKHVCRKFKLYNSKIKVERILDNLALYRLEYELP